MKIIKIQDIIIKYDLENIIKDANNISYKKDNYINNHRNGDGLPYKDAPSEKQFIEMRTAFINNILSIEKENKLTDLISENLFLTKKGVLAKSRRRPILMADNNFYTNIIDEYDHDTQFIRPYLKLERISDKEATLIIHEMQTDY